MPKQTEGEIQDCPTCGWQHRPSQPCPKTKWRKEFAGIGDSGDFAKMAQKFAQWEQQAKENPGTAQPTGKVCPQCRQSIYRFTNFLGAEWTGYLHPTLAGDYVSHEDHNAKHTEERRKQVEAEVVLERPQRPRNDDDDRRYR